MSEEVTHPPESVLISFAEKSLHGRQRTWVRRHLADCFQCRSVVDEYRVLAWRLRALPDRRPPAGTWARISSRLDAGDEVRLASSARLEATGHPDVRPTGTGRRSVWAVAAAAVVALAFVLWDPTGLPASRSSLRLHPGTPTAGSSIEAKYVADGRLADRDSVMMRGRLYPRSAHSNAVGRPGPRTVAILRRTGERTFEGSFSLPDSVVYATFVVESPGGTVVDRRNRRGWELLVHDDEGGPVYEALAAKRRELMGRNWTRALETARLATRLHPGEPEAWWIRWFMERGIAGPEARDQLRGRFVTRLRSFEASVAALDDPSGDTLAVLMHYARSLDLEASASRWRKRLLDMAPFHPMAVQERAVEIGSRLWGQPDRLLAALDSVWTQAGPVHETLAEVGYQAALAHGGAEDLRRWGERLMHFGSGPGVALDVYAEWADREGLRPLALARIEELLSVLQSEPARNRGLFEDATEARRSNARIRQRALTVAGALYRERGDSVRALAALTRAASVKDVWNPSVFRRAADLLAATGDSARALELWARVAVDPATPASYRDSMRTMLGPERRPSWKSALGHARREMEETILGRASFRKLPDDIHLRDGEGRRRSLSELTGNRVVFVAYWSRYCGYSLEDLPELARLAGRLEDEGVRVVAVTAEAETRELDQFLETRGLTELPVFHDVDRELARALEVWGTPRYALLDDRGRVAFERNELDSVERRAAILGAWVERNSSSGR